MFQNELLKSNYLPLRNDEGVQNITIVFPLVGNQFPTLKWHTKRYSAPSEVVFLGSESERKVRRDPPSLGCLAGLTEPVAKLCHFCATDRLT